MATTQLEDPEIKGRTITGKAAVEMFFGKTRQAVTGTTTGSVRRIGLILLAVVVLMWGQWVLMAGAAVLVLLAYDAGRWVK